MKLNPVVIAALALVGLGSFAYTQTFTQPPPAGVAMMGCVYQTSPPTFSNGNSGYVQCDNAGQVKVASGSSSGGGAVTIADGADVTQGTTTDAACATDNGTCTVLAVIKRVAQRLTTINTTLGTPMQQTGGSLAANQSVNLAQVAGTNTVNGGVAGSQSIGGTVATNVAITSNPVNLGAQAVSAENTVVTATRQVQLVADLAGKQIVLPYANPENFVSGVITSAMTGTTSTSLIAAPAAGLRNYITQCTFSNSHATVGTLMALQDGNGGTAFYNAPAAAVYGGATLTFPTPLRQPTTATAVYVVNITTGASTFAACSGYKGA